jgi:hypothetical protein
MQPGNQVLGLVPRHRLGLNASPCHLERPFLHDMGLRDMCRELDHSAIFYSMIAIDADWRNRLSILRVCVLPALNSTA